MKAFVHNSPQECATRVFAIIEIDPSRSMANHGQRWMLDPRSRWTGYEWHRRAENPRRDVRHFTEKTRHSASSRGRYLVPAVSDIRGRRSLERRSMKFSVRNRARRADFRSEPRRAYHGFLDASRIFDGPLPSTGMTALSWLSFGSSDNSYDYRRPNESPRFTAGEQRCSFNPLVQGRMIASEARGTDFTMGLLRICDSHGMWGEEKDYSAAVNVSTSLHR